MKKFFPSQSLIFNISSLLVVLFPASLIAGSFVSELFMNITSILVVFMIIQEKKYYYFKNKLTYFFLIFCMYLLIRSYFSQDKILSFEASTFYFRYGLFIIAILYLIEEEKKFLNIFFISFLITFTILIFDGYFQFFSGQNIFGFKVDRPDRLGGLFFDELILGSFILKFLPFLCISFFFFKNKKIKNFILFLLFVAYFLVLLSGERAAFILVNFFVFCSAFGIIKIKRFLFLSFFFISLITILIFSNNNLKSRYYDQFIIHLIQKTPSGKIVIFPEYAHLFKVSQNMFLDNVLFGQGPKTYRALCFKKKFRKNLHEVSFRKGHDVYLIHNIHTACTTHTHNYYLQILSEIGLIGFFFIFWFYINLLKNYYYAIKKQNKINVLIISGLIVNLWPLTTTGSFFNNWISMTLYFLIAFYFYFYKNENSF